MRSTPAFMITLDVIRRRLADHIPLLLSPPGHRCAAVAMLLRPENPSPELLLVQRASHADDPWSGDLGFPGGKVEAADGDPRRTAERETFEETGLDLGQAAYLGRLDDIAGAHLPIVVSCFVYSIDRPADPQLSDELSDAFWVPLAELADPERNRQMPVRFRGEPLQRPAIVLADPARPVLWGITYRLLSRFFDLCETPPTQGTIDS